MITFLIHLSCGHYYPLRFHCPDLVAGPSKIFLMTKFKLDNNLAGNQTDDWQVSYVTTPGIL
jgi:hypothetical protein